VLQATGLPWVIENVPGAPLRPDYLLCGSMFGLEVTCKDGKRRQLRRHRWFETNWPIGLQPPCAHSGQPVGVYGTGGGGQMTRGYKATADEARSVMGVSWMNHAEVSQAIPPLYTSHIGAALLEHIKSRVAA
jgi:DNA (cytosine-5)-methyltransferase 1